MTLVERDPKKVVFVVCVLYSLCILMVTCTCVLCITYGELVHSILMKIHLSIVFPGNAQVLCRHQEDFTKFIKPASIKYIKPCLLFVKCLTNFIILLFYM